MAQPPCRFTTASLIMFSILDGTYWLNKEKHALKSFLKAHNYKPRLAETPKKTYNQKHV